MRKLNFNEYYRKNLANFAKMRVLLISSKGRRIGRKPRDREEQELLFLLTEARWERWQREGKLEILGPRKYRLNYIKESGYQSAEYLLKEPLCPD